jgi:hypothetical protein
MGLYAPPSAVEINNQDGTMSQAMLFAAVPESVKEFFAYVKALEVIANQAATCHK